VTSSHGRKVLGIKPTTASSLRRRLLLGVLVPVILLLLLNSAVLYQRALKAADTAYDRTLLATAKSLGEQLEWGLGEDGQPQVKATLPYAALDAFEADNRSRIYYRISGLLGETVLGFDDLPRWSGLLPEGLSTPYAALVHFYDASFRDTPVRMAVLLQPVAGPDGQGMATIQVAETLELRQTLARSLLQETLWREALLIAVIAGLVVWVVQRATQPIRDLSATLERRDEGDLTPIDMATAPKELLPLVAATNHTMSRLGALLAHQQRFVRDASHQLRTPLAVLKAQVQSARRGDMPPMDALRDIERTTDGATHLANQMLALAKVEQLRQQGDTVAVAWDDVVREVALDLAPLMAARNLQLNLDAQSVNVRAHAWSLRELTRNLMHNAIQHSPEHGALTVTLGTAGRLVVLAIADDGPGLADDVQATLFQPFAVGAGASWGTQHGAGLGLAICHDIAMALGGELTLKNRAALDGPLMAAGAPKQGLLASVRLQSMKP
jgi:two-component system, OmpR family, sensor histidine kinase TctE